jgi:hypothetical protein
MKRSEQPRIELAKAKACIEGMRFAKSLEDFEEDWKTLLHMLERVWNKTLSHYSRSPKWNGWKGRYQQNMGGRVLIFHLIVKNQDATPLGRCFQ